MLKKATILFTAMAMVFASSCYKDDNSQPNDSQEVQSPMTYDELIIGNWDCISSSEYMHMESYMPWVDEWYTDIDSTLVNGWRFYGDRWKFTDNGTWYVNAYDYGTYVVSADMLALTHPQGDSRTHYSYIISELTNNKLVLSDTIIREEFSGYYGYSDDTIRRSRSIYRYEFVRR